MKIKHIAILCVHKRLRVRSCLIALLCLQIIDGRACLAKSLLVKHHYGLENWRLEVVQNQFTSEVICRLYDHHRRIVYLADALGFGFGPQRDVSKAWFRIADRPPMRWRDQLPELARLGVPLDGRRLDAPTDGRVWIPIRLLAGDTSIAIQVAPGQRSHRYQLAGLDDFIRRARALGCSPDDRFIL